MKAVVRLLLLLTLTISVSACSVLFPIKDEFDRNSREYGQMLRWQEFEKAAGIYVEPSLRDEYRKRIEAGMDAKIVDYRVISVDCEPEKKKAEVRMELDYYLIPSARVKTVSDTQKWRYFEEPDRKGWRLESLLPEFK